ncbi:hypothetical protein Ahia01_000296600 [Argonauta hians]
MQRSNQFCCFLIGFIAKGLSWRRLPPDKWTNHRMLHLGLNQTPLVIQFNALQTELSLQDVHKQGKRKIVTINPRQPLVLYRFQEARLTFGY